MKTTKTVYNKDTGQTSVETTEVDLGIAKFFQKIVDFLMTAIYTFFLFLAGIILYIKIFLGGTIHYSFTQNWLWTYIGTNDGQVSNVSVVAAIWVVLSHIYTSVKWYKSSQAHKLDVAEREEAAAFWTEWHRRVDIIAGVFPKYREVITEDSIRALRLTQEEQNYVYTLPDGPHLLMTLMDEDINKEFMEATASKRMIMLHEHTLTESKRGMFVGL